MNAMPKWKAAPEELTARFARALDSIPDAEPRKMFGYLAGFINRNMFAGIFQDSIIVKLPENERDVLVKLGGTIFSPMPGRVMREYVVLPPTIANQPKKMGAWLARACDFVATLPPKAKKSSAKKATKTRRA